MHGGLSEDENVTLDEIRKINRNRQPPESGIYWLFVDLKSFYDMKRCL